MASCRRLHGWCSRSNALVISYADNTATQLPCLLQELDGLRDTRVVHSSDRGPLCSVWCIDPYVRSCLRATMSTDHLIEFVSNGYRRDDPALAVEVLDNLTRIGRFDMLVMFLASAEKQGTDSRPPRQHLLDG